MARIPSDPGTPVTTTLIAYPSSEGKRLAELLRLVPGLTRHSILHALVMRGLAEVRTAEDVLRLREHFGPQARKRLDELVREGVLADLDH
jgi:hypothetical protein